MIEIPSGEVVTAGKFLVNHHPIVVLFDSGASHSFMSPAFASKYNQNGIRADPCGFTGACVSCAGMVCMAGVDLEWSPSMAHALALDTRTWPRGDVPGLRLTDEDVGLLRE